MVKPPLFLRLRCTSIPKFGLDARKEVLIASMVLRQAVPMELIVDIRHCMLL
jgi:hypothetical protein